jgi:hypothetical protein
VKKIQIEFDGKMTIQRAPIGITALPCYSNNEKGGDMTMTCAEALKKLKLYKYDNENITDVSSLIGKWKACDRINISNNKVRAAFFISNTRKKTLIHNNCRFPHFPIN